MVAEGFVRNGIVRIAVRDYGGEGSPIVFVHDVLGNLAVWDGLAPMLTERFRVITYDARAHGLSDSSPDLSVLSQADDLAAVIQACEVDRPFVVASALGSTVALEYAFWGGALSGLMVLDGPVVEAEEGDKGELEVPVALLEASNFVGPLEDLAALLDQRGITGGHLEAVARRQHQPGGDGQLRTRPDPSEAVRLLRGSRVKRIDSRFDRLDCPTLLVLAQRVTDGAAGARDLAARHADATDLAERHSRVEIAWVDAAPALDVGAPEAVSVLVTAFIDRTLG